MAREWYCEVEGRLYGPLEPADLKHMAKRGDLRPTDKIRQGDAGKWVEARKAKGLFNRPSSRAEPMSAAPIAPEASVAIKDSATPDDDAIASWLGKPPSAPSPPPPSKSAAPPPADPAADWFPTGFDESDLLDKSPFSAHGTMVRGTSPDERKKPCPFCGEGILEVAKKCKHCGEILDPALRPSVAQSQPVPMPSKKPASSAATKLNGVIGCAGLFTLFICCGGIGQMLSPNVGQQPAETSSQAVPASAVDNQAPVAASQPAPSPARSQAAIESDEKFSAIQMAQVFVKRQLTHPSSASFPWSGHNATRADDDAWHVTGTVRAKNSFNLELTYSYAVLIRHLEGTRWSLLDIAINESRE